MLLAHALKQVSKVAQIIGVNFVVIHAKDQKAMEFYQRFGFISLTSNPLTLIYPVVKYLVSIESGLLAIGVTGKLLTGISGSFIQ